MDWQGRVRGWGLGTGPEGSEDADVANPVYEPKKSPGETGRGGRRRLRAAKTAGPYRRDPSCPAAAAAAGSDSATMGASFSSGWAARGPAPEPKANPEEALDLSQLPPELLLVVLSHVPPRALLGRCRRVCRGWRALVDGQALWLLILARDRGAAGRALLSLVRRCLPQAGDARPCPLGLFCLRRPIGRNLIRNPCGQEGLQQWVVQHGGHRWVVEENKTPVPGAPSQTCFVTSFSWCSKKQVLDLQEEGLWPELLDSDGIEIYVSDWWGARHDCGCEYQIRVQLLDARQTVLDEFFETPDPIQQWNNNINLQVTHVFSNIRTGVRFVSFEHKGKDTQYWAGHYGARVTNSSVIVRVRLPQQPYGQPTNVPLRSWDQ
ncbi:F-box only protein 27 [Tupaia chinensis]|uniref:F-box only protein 27 n=1 Tax=Tupaia chinensis TaxID=246437 RepID=UPI0007046CA6|nr:F-box only protein 27 [Tupaia chinensis]